jgi:biopolymer transport protein ExbD
MVVTSMAPSEPVRDLDLPQASVSQAAGGGRPLDIDITREPVRPIYLAGQSFSAAELSAHLADRPLAGRAVVLRADRQADSALISRVARDCYRHGAGSVAFSLKAEN